MTEPTTVIRELQEVEPYLSPQINSFIHACDDLQWSYDPTNRKHNADWLNYGDVVEIEEKRQAVHTIEGYLNGERGKTVLRALAITAIDYEDPAQRQTAIARLKKSRAVKNAEDVDKYDDKKAESAARWLLNVFSNPENRESLDDAFGSDWRELSDISEPEIETVGIKTIVDPTVVIDEDEVSETAVSREPLPEWTPQMSSGRLQAHERAEARRLTSELVRNIQLEVADVPIRRSQLSEQLSREWAEADLVLTREQAENMIDNVLSASRGTIRQFNIKGSSVIGTADDFDELAADRLARPDDTFHRTQSSGLELSELHESMIEIIGQAVAKTHDIQHGITINKATELLRETIAGVTRDDVKRVVRALGGTDIFVFEQRGKLGTGAKLFFLDGEARTAFRVNPAGALWQYLDQIYNQ